MIWYWQFNENTHGTRHSFARFYPGENHKEQAQ